MVMLGTVIIVHPLIPVTNGRFIVVLQCYQHSGQHWQIERGNGEMQLMQQPVVDVHISAQPPRLNGVLQAM